MKRMYSSCIPSAVKVLFSRAPTERARRRPRLMRGHGGKQATTTATPTPFVALLWCVCLSLPPPLVRGACFLFWFWFSRCVRRSQTVARVRCRVRVPSDTPGAASGMRARGPGCGGFSKNAPGGTRESHWRGERRRRGATCSRWVKGGGGGGKRC